MPQAVNASRSGDTIKVANGTYREGVQVRNKGRKGIRIIGSIVGTRADLAEVFRLHAAGRTQVLYEARWLNDINASIEDVLASRVPARLVLLP